jgi:hypothetical protein
MLQVSHLNYIYNPDPTKQMRKLLFLFSLISLLVNSVTIASASSKKQISLVNNVSVDSKNDHHLGVGNGFVARVNGKDFAITAKHVLLIVKSEKRKGVSISTDVKQWKMSDKHDESNYLIVNELLNTNEQEALNWETLKNDWLVFSIKQNNANTSALAFRDEPLVHGEKLYIVGWAYEDKIGPQRTYQFTFEASEEGMHTLKQVSGPKSLAGLSGAPVVDKSDKLVGVVSVGWKDESTNVTYVQASEASEIKRFIDSHFIR